MQNVVMLTVVMLMSWRCIETNLTLDIFDFQIQLACDLKKPLFLHERDAHPEMVELLTR